jgi:hypothetical protein
MPSVNVDLESDDIAGEWRWRLVRSHLFGRFQICQVHGTAGARTVLLDERGKPANSLPIQRIRFLAPLISFIEQDFVCFLM